MADDDRLKNLENKVDKLEKKLDEILFYFQDNPNLAGHKGIYTIVMESMQQVKEAIHLSKENSQAIKENENEIAELRKSHKLRERFKIFTGAIFGGSGTLGAMKMGPAFKAFLKSLWEWIQTW